MSTRSFWPSRAGIVRTLVVAGAVACLEVLCRTGVINRLTMIPPTEMASALWQIIASGKFNADILYQLAQTLTLRAIVIAQRGTQKSFMISNSCLGDISSGHFVG